MDITFLTATHGANVSRPAPTGTEHSQGADDQGFARQLARLGEQANRAEESPRTESVPAEGEPVTEHSQSSDDPQASPLTGPAEAVALAVPVIVEQSREPELAPGLPTDEAPAKWADTADGVDASLAAISRRMALMDNAGQLNVPNKTPHALRHPVLPTRLQQDLSANQLLERQQQSQPIAAHLATPSPAADTLVMPTQPAQGDIGLPGPVQDGGESMFTQGFTLGNGVTAGTQQPLSPSTAATLSAPVATQAWQQQLGQQLIGLAMRRDQSMELHLNPIELGPLQVSLKLAEQGAQAHFMSAHATVRQAIEQAIPQLREALAEQGISLGETSIGEQDRQQSGSFAHEQPGRAASADEPTETGVAHSLPAEVDPRPLVLDGRVDLYA